MKELFKYKKEIERLCELYNVKSLYSFGSVFTDKFNAKSDVDFIVDFNHAQINDYADNYYALKFSLQETLKRSVDLLEEKAIKNPYFIQSIKNKRQLIYRLQDELPEWQKDLIDSRLKAIASNPERVKPIEKLFDLLNKEE